MLASLWVLPALVSFAPAFKHLWERWTEAESYYAHAPWTALFAISVLLFHASKTRSTPVQTRRLGQGLLVGALLLQGLGLFLGVNVVQYLARRYRVADEAARMLVANAFEIGRGKNLDPLLILSVVAIESSLNPFAQSPMGAQGLMQVMTRVHDDKYHAFGGTHAAFDPVTNLRVGVQVLKECIARAGSLEGGLKYYVGAANLPDDGGYAGKVLAEQAYLRSVASGRQVAVNAPIVVAPPAEPAASASEPAAPDAVEEAAPKADAERIALR